MTSDNVYKLIEDNGLTLHGDIEHFAALIKQRTWVGLTEQEHIELAIECGCLSADWLFYGAALERKIKEKNEI